MSVQHKSIPDAELHEPKGAISALAKQVYVSNGVGGGSWQIPDSTTLKGLVGDSGVAGKKLLTNGSNGFTMVTDTSYGVEAITANSTPFPVTAVGDTSFNTASQFSFMKKVKSRFILIKESYESNRLYFQYGLQIFKHNTEYSDILTSSR